MSKIAAEVTKSSTRYIGEAPVDCNAPGPNFYNCECPHGHEGPHVAAGIAYTGHNGKAVDGKWTIVQH